MTRKQPPKKLKTNKQTKNPSPTKQNTLPFPDGKKKEKELKAKTIEEYLRTSNEFKTIGLGTFHIRNALRLWRSDREPQWSWEGHRGKKRTKTDLEQI